MVIFLAMIAADSGKTDNSELLVALQPGSCVNAHLADEKTDVWEGWQLSQHLAAARV